MRKLLELSDKTRAIVQIIYAVASAVALLLVVTGAIFGFVHVPEDVATTIWRALITIIVAAGPFIASQFMKWTSDVNAKETQAVIHNRIAETEQKLTDGIGEKVAEKVVELQRQPWNGENRRSV
jgi:hypothetical protein